MPSLCTVTIVVPELETPRIQELHPPVYHWLCEALAATAGCGLSAITRPATVVLPDPKNVIRTPADGDSSSRPPS